MKRLRAHRWGGFVWVRHGRSRALVYCGERMTFRALMGAFSKMAAE